MQGTYSLKLSVIALLVFCSYTTVMAQSSPVAFWFDDSVSYTVTNHGYSNVKGTLYQGNFLGNGISFGPKWTTVVPFLYQGNHSLYFNGGNQNVSLGTNMDFFVHDFTVEAWIDPQVNQSTYEYISQATNGTNTVLQFRLQRIDTTLQLQALIADSTDTSWTLLQSDTGAIVTNQWQHVAVTFDTVSGAKLYINGKMVDQISTMHPSASPVYWWVGNNSANSFQGWMDDYRISDFARVPGDGSGRGISLAWNATIGIPPLASDSAAVAVLEPDPNSATSDGMATFKFITQALYDNNIPYALLDPADFSWSNIYNGTYNGTDPNAIYKYKLVIVPDMDYGSNLWPIQKTLFDYFYAGGRVIMFDVPSSIGAGTYTPLSFIYGMTSASGSIPNPPVMTVTSFGDSVFSDSTVTLEPPSAFLPYTVSNYGSKVAMTFGAQNYDGIVFTRDEANAYIAAPLTINGTLSQFVARERMFNQVVTTVLAHNPLETPLPDSIAAINFGPAPQITLQDGVLDVDGKPFYPKGLYYGWNWVGDVNRQTPDYWMRYYTAHDFNTIVLPVNYDNIPDISYAEGWLNAAQQYGMKVILYFGILYRDEWTLGLLQLRNHPALLGYILEDDGDWWELPAINQWANLIRKYDQRNLLTSTLNLDFRKPSLVTDPTAWSQWKTFFNQPNVFPLPYTYPLMKDGVFLTPDIVGGISDMGRLANNVENEIGNRYQHQWVQVLQQTEANSIFGLSVTDNLTENFVPSPEQLRLELYEALIAGVEGTYLFYSIDLVDQGLGRGRLNEAGIVFRQFDFVNDLITLGTRAVVTSANYSSQIEASSFTYHGSTVTVIRRKNYPEYVKYVDDSTLTDLQIPQPAVSGTSYLIDFPAIDTLQTTSGIIHIPNFDLTAMVLTTSSQQELDSIESKINYWLPLAAKEAFEVLKEDRAEMDVVVSKVASYRALPAGVPALIDSGAIMYVQVARTYASGDYADCYTMSHQATLIYRRIQRLMMDQANSYWQTSLSGNSAAQKYLVYYFGLPKFYQLYAAEQPVATGELGTDIVNEIDSLDNVTGIAKGNQTLPEKYELYQNYPNPFNPSTTISYDIPKQSQVSLMVYDVLGRQVAVLVDEKENAGHYSIQFDASRFASGVYFYRLSARGGYSSGRVGSFTKVEKMAVIK